VTSITSEAGKAPDPVLWKQTFPVQNWGTFHPLQSSTPARVQPRFTLLNLLFGLPMQQHRKVKVKEKKVLVAMRSHGDIVTVASIKMLGKMLLLALIGIVMTANYAHAQTLKRQLVGSWSLVSVVNDVDGKKIDLYGPNPQGEFTFTADGHFSENLMRPGRPKFAVNNRLSGTAEENKEALAGYLSLFGTYTINSDGLLMLHVVGSSFPNWDGTEQQRRVQIKGTELTWSNSTPSTGSGNVVIMLRRSK